MGFWKLDCGMCLGRTLIIWQKRFHHLTSRWQENKSKLGHNNSTVVVEIPCMHDWLLGESKKRNLEPHWIRMLFKIFFQWHPLFAWMALTQLSSQILISFFFDKCQWGFAGLLRVTLLLCSENSWTNGSQELASSSSPSDIKLPLHHDQSGRSVASFWSDPHIPSRFVRVACCASSMGGDFDIKSESNSMMLLRIKSEH